MEVLGSLTLNCFPSPSRPSRPPRLATPTPSFSGKRACCSCSSSLTSRRPAVLVPAAGVASLLFARCNFFAAHPASAQQEQMADELQQEEDRLVKIFQEASPSVVFIKDLEIAKSAKGSGELMLNRDDDAKLEGTGSGFIWDKFGHIVTNYHVIAKLAADKSGLQRCKVYLVDAAGNSFVQEGKITGLDPAYDLAVLKVDTGGHQVKPASLGSSHDLRVGQSCFAIGNPYGYENTLTTGVVSGLGREIPSPDGRAIRGAIQTDAAINSGKSLITFVHILGYHPEPGLEKNGGFHANPVIDSVGKGTGNSGGPLINSYGHVIGVNTATFTRKGTGVSSGVNFAIPIDTVARTVPYLIVYGTPYSNRF